MTIGADARANVHAASRVSLLLLKRRAAGKPETSSGVPQQTTTRRRSFNHGRQLLRYCGSVARSSQYIPRITWILNTPAHVLNVPKHFLQETGGPLPLSAWLLLPEACASRGHQMPTSSATSVTSSSAGVISVLAAECTGLSAPAADTASSPPSRSWLASATSSAVGAAPSEADPAEAAAAGGVAGTGVPPGTSVCACAASSEFRSGVARKGPRLGATGGNRAPTSWPAAGCCDVAAVGLSAAAGCGVGGTAAAGRRRGSGTLGCGTGGGRHGAA